LVGGTRHRAAFDAVYYGLGIAEKKRSGGGEGLSLQTLVIAAVASAAAAIVVSHIWKGGTVIAAAMTPVIVSIVKELLAKPLESELVKKPVAKIASGSRAVVGTAAGGRIGRSQPDQRGHGDPLLNGDPHEPPTQPRGAQPDPGMSPIRTYGSTPRSRVRRPVHLKVALITGVVAFVIAAAALTLPELIFGGAISSHHSTTLFGGGSKKKDTSKTNEDGKTSTQPTQQQQQTTPQQTTPQGTTPQQTTPQQTAPQQTAPQQTTPQQTTPVPTTPTPPVP
jgi:uncharacterized membrane protein YvlD (DUF360 family)